MILSALVSRLRERVGNPDTTDVTDASLINRISEAYEDIWDNFKFNVNREIDSSIVTAAGTVSYSLPIGTDVILSVRDNTNNLRLKSMDRFEYDELGTVANSKPTRYFRAGDVIYLDPPPDGVYTIRLRRKPAYTAPVASNDEPTIPRSWHNGIVLLARYKFWEVKEDGAKAQIAWLVWDNWRKNKTDEMAEEAFHDPDRGIRAAELEVSTQRFDFDHED